MLLKKINIVRFRKGVTRIVILIGDVAIKIPNVRSWKQYLLGLLANIQEREFAKLNHELLAKVKFSDLLGFVLVMERTEDITDIDEEDFRTLMRERYKDNEMSVFILSDLKRANFGYIKNTKNIVKIDYGNL